MSQTERLPQKGFRIRNVVGGTIMAAGVITFVAGFVDLVYLSPKDFHRKMMDKFPSGPPSSAEVERARTEVVLYDSRVHADILAGRTESFSTFLTDIQQIKIDLQTIANDEDRVKLVEENNTRTGLGILGLMSPMLLVPLGYTIGPGSLTD